MRHHSARMKRIAIVLSLLLSCLPASAQQTQSNVQAQINAKVLPNGKQAITGAVLNGVLTTMNAATLFDAPTGLNAAELPAPAP